MSSSSSPNSALPPGVHLALGTIEHALTGCIAQRTPEGVTENDNEAPHAWPAPPSNLSTEQLREGHWLPLSAIPVSPRATALVTHLATLVASHEGGTRQRNRGKAGAARQQQAIGAIIGGILRRWGREQPQLVFRSRKRDDFSGGPVPARQYLAAYDALLALGLIQQSRSIRYGSGIVWIEGGPEHFAGKAPRLWPAHALLDLAVAHGVTPATVTKDFGDTYPTRPPAVPELVQVFTLKRPRKSEKAPVAIRHGDPLVARIRQEVESSNEWLGQHEVRGCLPPRLKRVFTASWLLGGRWYAVGNEGNYQRMSEGERLGIIIDRAPVAEVDVKACHLSIMHGLLGLPLPEGDPYEFPGAPRPVVKAWITGTLGKGSPVRQWAKRTLKANPELSGHDAGEIGRIICERYGFLRSPARAVAGPAGLDRLAYVGPPERLLTHRLMAIEAEALTMAMWFMRAEWHILALPLHDALIVPHDAVAETGDSLRVAFQRVARVPVRWTADRAPELAYGRV